MDFPDPLFFLLQFLDLVTQFNDLGLIGNIQKKRAHHHKPGNQTLSHETFFHLFLYPLCHPKLGTPGPGVLFDLIGLWPDGPAGDDP